MDGFSHEADEMMKSLAWYLLLGWFAGYIFHVLHLFYFALICTGSSLKAAIFRCVL